MVRKAFVLAALCLALVACRENRESERTGLKQFVCMTEQPGGKTSLSGMAVVWSPQDQIKVYSSACPDGLPFSLQDEGTGAAVGTFVGAHPGTAPYMAVYPAGMEQTFVSTSAVSLVLPGEQTYQKGGFAPGANPAVAFSSGDNLSFRNACGLLCLRVTGTARITQLSLSTSGEEKLWGAGSVTADAPAFVSAADGAGDGTVVLTCAEPVQLGDEATAFHFVLPAGSLSEGFTVTLRDDAGGAMTLTGAGGGRNTISRSAICTMPAFAYLPDDSAFLREGVYGVYDLSSGMPVALKAYVAGTDQLALRSSSSGMTFRIQSLSGAYALSVRMPGSIQVGSRCQLAVSSIGTTGVADASVNVVLMKAEGGKRWFLDQENNVGYIMAEAL